ncbi:MAG: efflux RND transporter periplasmic adaptor subunit [Chloroflexi bacterium]|nr:efflux RND transporter periplasmic adaptor subunit [Chloroflexota bacterium]
MSVRRVFLGLVSLLLVGAVAGCAGGVIPPTPMPDWMTTTADVERASMSESVAVLGQLSPVEGLTLTFGVADGRVLEVFVQLGQTIAEGDPLARLDTAATERLLREAEADLVVAQAQLDAAVRAASEMELARARTALAAAEHQVAAAKLALDLATEAGVEPYELGLADAQFALQSARDAYTATSLEANLGEIRQLEYQQAFFERALRDLAPGADPTESQTALKEVKEKLAAAQQQRAKALSSGRDAIAQGERKVALAQTALDDVKSGKVDVSAEERLALQRAIVARDQALKALDLITGGGDPDKLAAAQTAYEAAVAKVDGYKASIEAATLKSPIDGTVLDLYVAPNDWASASTQIAYIADPSLRHIVAQVSEVDIVRLGVGQPVRVSFDALPGVMATGHVETVDVRGQTDQGAVTYQVEIVLDEAVEGLIQGMTATVRVLVGERDNVLVVPAAAVQYDMMGQPVVYVRANDGSWVSTSVELGMNDGIVVEVLDGLEEGQTVRIPVTISAPTTEEGGSEVQPLR